VGSILGHISNFSTSGCQKINKALPVGAMVICSDSFKNDDFSNNDRLNPYCTGLLLLYAIMVIQEVHTFDPQLIRGRPIFDPGVS